MNIDKNLLIMPEKAAITFEISSILPPVSEPQ